MMKKILLKYSVRALKFALTYIYDYVDKDNDGKLSYYELECLVDDARKILTKIKRKI